MKHTNPCTPKTHTHNPSTKESQESGIYSPRSHKHTHTKKKHAKTKRRTLLNMGGAI